jgi:hypothetical protein
MMVMAASARSIDKQMQAGRLLILPPWRIGPPIVWPQWKAPIGSKRKAPDQPNVWPGMQVLVVGSASAGFMAKAAERTAPDGKVVVISPDGGAMRQLEKRLDPRGFDHLVLETCSPGQIPLPDHSIDRAFLVMGLRQIPSLDRTLGEIRRVVQPEGQIVVHRRFLFAGLLPRRRIVRTCLEAGFDPAASDGTLLQYTLTLEKRQSQGPAQGRSARTVNPGT